MTHALQGLPRRQAAALGALAAALVMTGAARADPETIELTQVACQFVESENGIDRGFTTGSKADCERINAETGAARLAEAEVLKLKPGTYVFRVTNKDVPYELGFWLREHDYDWRNPVHKLSKISVSGGGLMPGTTTDYEVELEPGEYLYSCPLNTTPDYRLVVTQ
jgi:hypothetical protein